MSKRSAATPRGIQWLVTIAVVILALAIVWALFVPLADWLARHDVGSAAGPLHETALDNARGRLLTLGAGLLAAGALIFTARNFTLSREGQVTDRYTKAIEQLGSDKLDVRIGGIYALERVARDSARDHPTVTEVLTAFIREHSHERWPPPGPDGQERERSVRPDVQAAVTVVARRDQRRDIRPIDLAGADLAGAKLAHTTVQADATGVVVTRVTFRASFVGAILADANLIDANLLGADLTRADLSRADLSRADLSLANLTRANLAAANLTDAHLDFAIFDFANLAAARWRSRRAPVPEGWELDTGTGRLERAGTRSGPTEAE